MSEAEYGIRRAKPEDAAQLADLVLGLMRHTGDALDGFDAARFTSDAFQRRLSR